MCPTPPAPAAPGATAFQRPEPITPLLKWPGGKARELPLILQWTPDHIERYFEPFVGGGAMLFAVPPSVPAFVNDASPDLMEFYGCVARQDPGLFTLLEGIDAWWQALQAVVEEIGYELFEVFLSLRERGPSASSPAHQRVDALLAARRDVTGATVPPTLAQHRADFLADVEATVPRKIARMRQVEVQRRTELPDGDVGANLEGAMKASCYTTLRRAYNVSRRGGGNAVDRAALFMFLREFAYAAMFRFNAAGDFNVPYGGVSYNRKSLARKVAHLRSAPVNQRLRGTVLGCTDFAAFLSAHAPQPGDFVFLDPPYDSDFRDYDGHGFGADDHERLAGVLEALDCRFLLVIKATPLTERLFARPGWHVVATDKTYAWTIKERNDRRAVHLLVTNHAPDNGDAARLAGKQRPLGGDDG